MSFKFNRGCWVESREEALLGRCMESGGKTEEGPVPGNGEVQEDHTGFVPIERKIELARFLHSTWGEALRNDLRIQGLLHQLEVNIDLSWQAMRDLGIDRACARCDATAPEGSCCSRGLENKYDAILLLINLLLGTNLDEPRSRADSCHFLGSRGCRLRVRNMLCVDYLCPEVEEMLGEESLIQMQIATGGEIETTFLLCDEIKKRIDPGSLSTRTKIL